MLRPVYRYAKHFIIAISLTSLPALQAAPINLSFWPTPVTVEDPAASGSLYVWPEFQVLLQTQVDTSTYTPARISDEVAAQLNQLFKAAPTSPIELYRNDKDLSWGLTIPGGELLRPDNQTLIEPMLEGFIACLGGLPSAELDGMKEVLYGPQTFVSPNGSVQLNEALRATANKMFESYKANRCDNQVTAVPELVKRTSRRYMAALLTGQNIENQVTDGALLVLTTLYKDLLFHSRGLWVRTTLALLQTHIGEVLAKLPAKATLTAFERDYASFVDFVLLTRDTAKLSKDQYLSIATACGIESVESIFSAFPLKKCVSERRLEILNVKLGTREATLFIKGGPA